MAKDSGSSGGISILGVLGVVFVVLKLIKVIDWTWWWVTCPFWGGFAVAAIFFLIGGILKLLGR